MIHFFELYAFIILTSTLVLGINYFVIITRPLHPIPVRKRSSSSCYMIETYNTHHRFPCYWTMNSDILNHPYAYKYQSVVLCFKYQIPVDSWLDSRLMFQLPGWPGFLDREIWQFIHFWFLASNVAGWLEMSHDSPNNSIFITPLQHRRSTSTFTFLFVVRSGSYGHSLQSGTQDHKLQSDGWNFMIETRRDKTCWTSLFSFFKKIGQIDSTRDMTHFYNSRFDVFSDVVFAQLDMVEIFGREVAWPLYAGVIIIV